MDVVDARRDAHGRDEGARGLLARFVEQFAEDLTDQLLRILAEQRRCRRIGLDTRWLPASMISTASEESWNNRR